MHTSDRPTLSCSSCARCPTVNCPARNDREGPRLRGRALGLAAVGLFLAPIALAIAGSLCFGGNEGAGFLGALLGLGLGMSVSWLCLRLIRGRTRGSTEKSP